MKKFLKTIIFIISILMLVLVFPSKVKAVTIDDNTKIWTFLPPGNNPSTGTSTTLRELKSGEKTAELTETHIFQNKFVFCYQMSQSLSGTNDYRVTNEFKLNNDKITNNQKYTYTTKWENGKKYFVLNKNEKKFEKTDTKIKNYAKGLAYILSFTNTEGVDQNRYGTGESYWNYSSRRGRYTISTLGLLK